MDSHSDIDTDDNDNDILISELEEILYDVPSDFFDDCNFNPFKHWKEDPNYLIILKTNLELAVSKIVELKYKGFNRSSSSFSNILAKFTAAQNLIISIQKNMQHSKRLLLGNTQSSNLQNLYYQSIMHKKVLDILDKMEFILSVPKRLDEFIKQKKFLHTVYLLIGTLGLLTHADINGIEALQDIHDELLSKRNIIQDLLIDEITEVLYKPNKKEDEVDAELKRGKSNIINVPAASFAGSRSDQVQASFIDVNSKPAGEMFPSFLPPMEHTSTSEMLFSEELKTDYDISPTNNPLYLHILVAALNKLDRLASAETAIARRVRDELKKIIVSESKDFKSSIIRKDKTVLVSSLGFVSPSSEMLVELMDAIFLRFSGILPTSLSLIDLFCTYLKMPVLPHYNAEHIWMIMQAELAEMIGEYMAVQKKQKMAPTLKSEGLISLSKTRKLDFSFSFENSQLPSMAQLTNKVKYEEPPEVMERAPLRIASYWITPSPYNMVPLYRRVVQFVDVAQSMMSSTNPTSSLRVFMNDFISNVLLPRIHADAHVKVQDIMSSPGSFKTSDREPNRDDEEKKDQIAVLRCSIEICEVIRQLFTDMFQLPNFVNQYVTVMEYVLGLFLEIY